MSHVLYVFVVQRLSYHDEISLFLPLAIILVLDSELSYFTLGTSEFSWVLFDGMCVCMLSCFSHDRLLAALWIVAHQASMSVGLSRQEY